MSERRSREELLSFISKVSFVVDDTKLFLDTHKHDREALKHLEEYRELRKAALEEYAKYYGPLLVDDAVMSCDDRWNWTDEPWPWMEGGC